MPRVLVRCTNCDRPIYTGLAFEQWFIFDWVEIQGATIECPACSATTSWSKGDAYLEADGGGD